MHTKAMAGLAEANNFSAKLMILFVSMSLLCYIYIATPTTIILTLDCDTTLAVLILAGGNIGMLKFQPQNLTPESFRQGESHRHKSVVLSSTSHPAPQS